MHTCTYRHRSVTTEVSNTYTPAHTDTGQSPPRSATCTPSHRHRLFTSKVSDMHTFAYADTGLSPKRSVAGTHLYTHTQVSHQRGQRQVHTSTHIHRPVTKEVSDRYTPAHTDTGQSLLRCE